jgi:hypothetical protein
MTTAELSDRIGDVHAQLHGTMPEQVTTVQKNRATQARNRALANGWTADTATDLEYARYSRAH